MTSSSDDDYTALMVNIDNDDRAFPDEVEHTLPFDDNEEELQLLSEDHIASKTFEHSSVMKLAMLEHQLAEVTCRYNLLRISTYVMCIGVAIMSSIIMYSYLRGT